jgi:hypothetical protein
VKLDTNFDDYTLKFLKKQGKKENRIIYRLGDIVCSRSMPANVNLSERTKNKNRMMGLSSRAGKTLRELLSPVLQFPVAGDMHKKFAGAISKSISLRKGKTVSVVDDLRWLRDFSFNGATSITHHWRADLLCTQVSANEIKVDIPPFVPTHVINAPANTTSIDCILAAACVRMRDGAAIGHDTVSMAITYHDVMEPARSKYLSATTENGCLVVVAAALMFQLTNGEKDNRVEFLPSSIIGAWYVK